MSERFYVTDTVLSERFPIYTRANVGEVFPDPVTPLTSSSTLWEEELGWRDAWVRMGAFDADELPPDDFCQLAVQGAYLHLLELEPPFVFIGRPDSPATWPRRDADTAIRLGVGEALAGIPGCSGVAEGIARVVLDSNDPSSLQPGDILVAPITDPSWTPLFVPAAGVVVDVGAPLSHAIIVSRELGIPCVISATGATRRIPDGARVRVDGNIGVVTVLSLP